MFRMQHLPHGKILQKIHQMVEETTAQGEFNPTKTTGKYVPVMCRTPSLKKKGHFKQTRLFLEQRGEKER